MKFNGEDKVIIDTLTPNEAEAFIKFLQSEILRHFRDIREARASIRVVRDKFMKGNQ